MKITADKIAEMAHGLADAERRSTIEDILIDLRDSLAAGPDADDADTWKSGFTAAIETITANYGG